MEEKTVRRPQNQLKTPDQDANWWCVGEGIVSMQGMRGSQKESYIDSVFKPRVPAMPQVKLELQ